MFAGELVTVIARILSDYPIGLAMRCGISILPD